MATSVQEEIATLERVLNRLVVTDDDKLSAVLNKLLPKLLRKLNDGPAVRAKVIDVLNHVSKRVRPNTTIMLPCADLLDVCREVPPTSFAFNFSLTFLEMAVPRLSSKEQGVIAANIAHGISRLKNFSQAQNIMLNVLLVVLEHLPLQGNPTDRDVIGCAGATSLVFQLGAEDSAVVIDWFLDICLYPGILTRQGSVYHGISTAGLARLTARDKSWSTELLTRRKLAVVRALKSDLVPPSLAVTPALAAACSSHHEVVKAAEDLLKSLSSSDRAGVLRRDPAVALNVLTLVLGGNQTVKSGTTAGKSDGKLTAVADLSAARTPASPALAVRALAWLETECAEGTASRVPEAVRVSFMAMFAGGGGMTPTGSVSQDGGTAHRDRANEARLRAAGARLATFIASKCDAKLLAIVGPVVLQAVQRVIMTNAAPTSVPAMSSTRTVDESAEGRTSEPPSVGRSSLTLIQHTAMLEACYEAIASLATRQPQLFAGDTSVPRLLFLELSAKEPGLRVKISAALGALKGAYRSANDDNLVSELWSLLWDAAASTEYRARLCAVEWACDLFEFSDVAARCLCVSLCGDNVTAVRSAALRGLHPRSPASSASAAVTTPRDANTTLGDNTLSSSYPTFDKFVLGALRDDAGDGVVRKEHKARVSVREWPSKALARALDFALECLKEHSHASSGEIRRGEKSATPPEIPADADNGRDKGEAVEAFLSLIGDTLSRAPSATDGQHGHGEMVLLHRSAAVALQGLAVGDFDSGIHEQLKSVDGSNSDVEHGLSSWVSFKAEVAKKLASRGQWLQQWLGHEGSTEIREAFAVVSGAAAIFMEPNAELVPLLRSLGLKIRPCTVPGVVGFSNRSVSGAHGAVCAVGAILARLAGSAGSASQASSAWRVLSDDAIPSALSCVTAAIGHPVSLLHIAACGAVGRVGLAASLPLPPGASILSLGDEVGEGPTTGVAREAGIDAGTEGSNDRVTTISKVFRQLWASCKLGETTDASRRAEAAAEALGKCCRGTNTPSTIDKERRGAQERNNHSVRVRTTLRVLFDLAKNQREEELQFAVGAAVADVACSGPLLFPSGTVLESIRASALAARRVVKAEDAGDGNGAVVIDAVDYVLYQLLYVLLEDNSPQVSGAAAVHLLAVVQGCRGHPLLGPYLLDIQAAFTRKLTVRSEFVQEVAGKGLAVVYEAADGEAKQALVDCLVEALSTGRRRRVESGTSGVDIYGTMHAGAALSEAGAGAYGEMCAVASDVGRPDLIYSFLNMASHHAAWSTRRGASLGLGAMIDVSVGTFESQLGRIVPRLFRYRYDPSTKTRSAMEQLWRSIVNGGGVDDFSTKEKEVIRLNLSAIIVELLRALGDRKWRDRQSACAGLADVLRGRSWDALGPHLEELWIMADRALDDIKESVAHAGVDFAKTLANVSVRLCDPYTFVPPYPDGTGNTEDPSSAAAAAAATAAAQSDAVGQGTDALREEVNEARRTIGTMMQDLRTSEAEARARGEEGMREPPGGLISGETRDATAEEVLRQVLAREQESNAQHAVAGGDGGIGHILGGERRNGPTVEEILRPGRGGAQRAGPPPSAAAREAATAAISVVLPRLLRKGILSRCKESQALSMRTVQRLVKVCDKEALTPHLPELIATLIEGLSALEPQALQYMQFHAETQLEMTQDQMERLRLSMSRAGPLQDALDQCYRHLDAPGIVAELIPRVLGLLRSGTGLATRSASAYLVLSLCERAPLETRRAAPRLLSTLTNTALSERSSTLRRTYSSALSSVARLAPAPSVTRLVKRLAQLFREADPDYDKRQRRTLALILGDLCRRAASQLGVNADGGIKVGDGNKSGDGTSGPSGSGWSQILPMAFVARLDPDKPVADAFKQAWQEGLTQLQLGAAGLEEESRVRNAKDAVLLMLPAVLAEVSAAISSVSRITKWQGCAALKEVASTLGPVLGETKIGRRLLRRVLSQMPGRTWEGKEELLEAVVAICSVGKGSAISLGPFVWGEADAVGGARGVKRNRSDHGEPDGEDETEAEQGEEELCNKVEQQPDEEMLAEAEGSVGPVGGNVETGSVAAIGDSGGIGGGTKPSAGMADEAADSDHGSVDNIDEDGDKTPFHYQDKLGDIEKHTVAAAAAEESEQGSSIKTPDRNDYPRAPSKAASTGLPKDSHVEDALALLEIEDDSPVPFGEVVAYMLAQLTRKNIGFRRAATTSLAVLLDAFPECCVYEMVAPTLLDLAVLGDPRPNEKIDPIMQARAVSCLASAWPRIPRSPSPRTSVDLDQRDGCDKTAATAPQRTATRDAVCAVQRKHAASLALALSRAIRRKVWSVRVPILNALSAVISRSYVPSTVVVTAAGGVRDPSDAGGLTPMPSVLTGALLAAVVQAVEVGAQDAKYSQVRAAANSVIVAMTSRKELQLALTPHKEGLVSIARAGAEDSEPRVAVEGSKAVRNLSWWP